MISFIKNYFNPFSEAGLSYGLHIHLSDEKEPLADLCKVNGQGGTIVLEEWIPQMPLKEAIERMDSNIPVYCSVDGVSVVHKRIAEKEGITLADHISQLMHQQDVDQFYGQLLPGGEGKSFLSVIRKETLNQLIQPLIAQGLFVCMLVLGPHNVRLILPLLSHDLRIIHAGNYSLQVEDGVITQISSDPVLEQQELQLGDEVISSVKLLPYVNALGHFAGKPEGLIISGESLARQGKEEFRMKILFSNLVRKVPVILLVLLLLNFMAFSYYSGENTRLSSNYGVWFQQARQSDSLQAELTRKQQILASLNWDSHKYCSFYADRLGQSLYDGIKLTRVRLFPLDEGLLEKEDRHHFSAATMIVEGQSKSPEFLGDWVLKLNDQEWVHLIEKQKYQWNSQSGTGEFSFELRIK